MEGLVEEKRTAAPILAAPEEEVDKARFTKRTLPALRKRFDLTQEELGKVVQVTAKAVGSWERGKNRPRSESVDSDGTAMRQDVLDKLIQSYSIVDSWKCTEERWQAGVTEIIIGSTSLTGRALAGEAPGNCLLKRWRPTDR